jgi:hypothetical protein
MSLVHALLLLALAGVGLAIVALLWRGLSDALDWMCNTDPSTNG